MSVAAAPQLLLRSRAKTQVVSAGPAGIVPNDRVTCSPVETLAEMSPDGRFLAVVEAAALRLIQLDSGEEVFSLPRPAVRALAFSPKGTYVLTWEKLVEGAGDNLRLWRCEDGGFVTGFVQKALGEKWQWPALRWSSDEKLFARAVANEVHFFDGAAPSTAVAHRLRVERVGQFALAPSGSPPLVATFVPEVKGAPATVRLWRYPDFDEGRFLATKTFFKASEAQLKFSPDGQSLLVRTHVDVDTGGKSYDGASGLFLINGKGESAIVRLPKEGPIHDVQWAPDSREYCALFGFSPPRAALFSADKGNALIHDFGECARNTCRWSPHGRSFILAGFGNLGGELSFWDRKTLRCLATVDAHMTVAYAWAPDSRSFLTAVLWPRLRVDNGYKLWSPAGALLHHQKVEELSIAAWRPADPVSYPPPPDDCFRAAAPSAAAAGPAAPRKYVPPGARGGAAAGAVAGGGGTSLSALAAAVDGAGSAAMRTGPVLGSEAEDKSSSRNAAKNKAKREAAKKKKDADAAPAEKGAVGAVAAPSGGNAEAGASGGEESADKLQKKVWGVEKKLRQIVELKELQAGGKALEKNQLDKVAGEEAVRKELEAMRVAHSKAEEKEQAAAKEGMWR
jgi:translation initiation factor 2A